MNWLVPFLVKFLRSEDWTVRKAAAEALGKVASVEKDLASHHEVLCLDSLQNQRFDKRKSVYNAKVLFWKHRNIN
ncbi:hypothetical protein P8452_10686 [Trifolium repens]|nr:hypothetical protein P8452_10686 [Trifolium repens]